MVTGVRGLYGSAMRWDWIPLSASALVIGVMALVFGALLNPVSPDAGAAETVANVADYSERYLGMSVMYFLASVSLTLGLPAVLSLFTRRARRLGVVAVVVFSVGVIGTSGYAMLLVFFRALVNQEAIRARSLQEVAGDIGLSVFLYSWIAAFYAGLLLLAVALFLARRTPVWVPIVLLVFVATFPAASYVGRFGQVLQVLLLAVAFTGIAMEAVHPRSQRSSSLTHATY